MLDQVNALVEARESDPEIGFMARLLMLCSLPRTNPGEREKYVRKNGPFTLVIHKWKNHEGESTDAEFRGGSSSSSAEPLVMRG